MNAQRKWAVAGGTDVKPPAELRKLPRVTGTHSAVVLLVWIRIRAATTPVPQRTMPSFKLNLSAYLKRDPRLTPSPSIPVQTAPHELQRYL